MMDKGLLSYIVFYFVTLIAVNFLGDPSNIRVEGVHQELGDCDVKDFDLSNYERRKYLCNNPKHPVYHAHYTYFDICKGASSRNPTGSWFAICSKADAVAHVGPACAIGALGLLSFFWAFRRPRRVMLMKVD